MKWKEYVVENYLREKGGEYELLKPAIREKIYGELTSNDESKILNDSKILIGLDNLNFTQKEISDIEKKCENLPKSKSSTMRDYRQDVNAVIMLIKHFDDGAKCKCGVYEKWIQFAPEREVEIGYLSIQKEPYTNLEKFQIEYDLKCMICKTEWQANQNDGYHYPIYEWIKKGVNNV